MKNIYFVFANFGCKIQGSNQQVNYIKKCYSKSPFGIYIKDDKPEGLDKLAKLRIKTTCNLQHNTEHFLLKSDMRRLFFTLNCSENLFFLYPVIEQVLRKIFYIMFFKSDGFVLHASATILNNRAFIFSGESGVGKSTVVLILKRENKDAKIIADNNVYIKKINNSFFIYPPAFLEWNLSREIAIVSRPYLIEKLYFLQKNSKYFEEKINFNLAFKKLCYHVQIPQMSLSETERANCRKILFEFTACLAKYNNLRILNFGLESRFHLW